ncbi:TM2 domain-containing protein [Vannielia litorea]|uniref:TM2 domain-containing protein n=1 Tax=Vannielia litorea TaxID=1217970 RepID=UPI001C95B6FE|nr:TM2 domain-containing protein [Vannielia litorea]MBY6047109.1 TM2 domain-containing protein [Vannielia litorea]MBY6074523.1 TM2 domain-containing protein [Vannielia litorea]
MEREARLAAQVAREMRREKKSLAAAYAFLVFGGGVAAHRFYLGRMRSGFVLVSLLWGGLLLSIAYVGIPLVLAGLVWQVVDLFLIPGMAREHLEDRKPYVARRLGVDEQAIDGLLVAAARAPRSTQV